MSSAADPPPAAAGSSNQSSSANNQAEVYPPGALILRGPHAGAAASQGTNHAPTVLAGTVRLPPDLSEVVRLQAAGVGDEVILAHIQNSPLVSPLTADEVLYLKDVGISPRVLTALLEHQQAQGGGPAGPPDQSAADMGEDYADQGGPLPEDYSDESMLPGPMYFNPVDYGYVYNSLAPYGTWMNLPGFGWCWQPTACAVNPSWRPYCDNGRWRWSDSGWYWQSGYSWGWAPFHYGRWTQNSRHGWLWHPDRTWAPAWVCWRQSGNACGWAPLPPGSTFTIASGWSLHGQPVNMQQPDFGLPASSFTFVAKDQFLHPALHRFGAPQANQAFSQSTPAERNGFKLTANNRVLNVGIDPMQVQSATHVALRPAVVGVGFSGRAAPVDSASLTPRSLNLGSSSGPGRTPTGTAAPQGRLSNADALAIARWMGLGQHPDDHVPQSPASHSAAQATGGAAQPWAPVVGNRHNPRPWGKGALGKGAGAGTTLVYPFGKPGAVVSGGRSGGGGAHR